MAKTGTHFDLKIFVDKEKGRVLFAEADGEFVDVLFSFLTLPLGTIARLIAKTPSEPASTLGCFGSLYQTVTGLGYVHFRAKALKNTLLHLHNSYDDMHRSLKINICGTGDRETNRASKGKVFFSKALKFIIADDLQVTPVVPGTLVGCFNNVGTNDLSVIEESTVKLGLDEITSVRKILCLYDGFTLSFVHKLLELLKWTLLSTTPLTDLFLSKTKLPLSSVPKKVPPQKKSPGEGTKINVKVVLNKSSKEFLFVEAGGDFVDFLFSLLLIPLGKMLHLMEGQSSLGSVDALYKSVRSLDSKHFSYEDHKSILLRPKLPPQCICKNHLFPLESGYTSGIHKLMMLELASGEFVREEEVFIVLDNLTVKPFSASEAISIMNAHKISFSDLEERTLSLGVAEGISILRASLDSTSAISNGLLHNSLASREPKLEK